MDITGHVSNLGYQVKRLLDRDPSTAGVSQRGQVATAGGQLSRRDAGVIQHRLSQDLVRSLVQDYESGRSVRQLAVSFGIHRSTVRRHLEHHGVNRRPSVRTLTDEQVREAGLLYQSGASLAVVGTQFGVDAATVRKELVRLGIAIRPRRGWTPS